MVSAGAATFFLNSGERSFALVPGDHVVGRSEQVEIRLTDDPQVSRRHCRLVVTQDCVEVEDLGSSNGTWVGSELVQHRLRLPVGATLRVGARSFTLRRAPGPRAAPETKVTAREIPSMRELAVPQEVEVEGTTQRRDAVAFVEADAARSLDAGRWEDARRLIDPMLDLVERANYELTPDGRARASVLGLRLALATGDDAYCRWVIRAHLRGVHLMDESVVEMLERAASQSQLCEFSLLGQYLAELRRSAPRSAAVALICSRLDRTLSLGGATIPAPPPSSRR